MDGLEIDENSDVLGSHSKANPNMCAAGAACAKFKMGDKVKTTLLAELFDGCVSEGLEVFKLTNGPYEDTIVSNFFSQHPSGELAIFLLQGRTQPQSSK